MPLAKLGNCALTLLRTTSPPLSQSQLLREAKDRLARRDLHQKQELDGNAE